MKDIHRLDRELGELLVQKDTLESKIGDFGLMEDCFIELIRLREKYEMKLDFFRTYLGDTEYRKQEAQEQLNSVISTLQDVQHDILKLGEVCHD